MATITAAVGLSFGSESCVVAVTNTSGNPQVYANADGDRITPTYVAFIDGEILHGTAARAAFVRQPVQSVPYLLPLLSAEVVNNGSLQPKCEVEVQSDAQSGEDRVVIPTADTEGVLASALPKPNADDTTTPHYVSELIASFLANVKSKTIDGSCSGRPIGCLCVSVPRYLDQDVVRTAIEGAGLAKEVRVIYDDVAAALAHQIGGTGYIAGGTHSMSDRKDVAIIDWGANVLAASLLRLEGGVFRVLSHTHRFNAGGASLDKHLAKTCCDAFMRKTKVNASENARSVRKLLLTLESVRKTLSMSAMSPIDIEAFCDGIDYKDNLSRVKLEMAIRECGLLEKLNGVLKDLMEVVDPCEAVNVKHIILSGGLCKTQLIQASVKSAVQSTLPCDADVQIHDSIPTDEVSALGACAEAVLTTASHASLTNKTPAELSAAVKYRPIDAAVKAVDLVEIDALDAGIALYIGSSAFSKTATIVSSDAVQEVIGAATNAASPTGVALKDFGKVAAERGAYKVANELLHVIAVRGAPMPVSSPLTEAAIGSAVLPVAVIAANSTHSFVVPLLTKPHQLATSQFKVLVAPENNGSAASVSIVEQSNEGITTVAQRSEW